MGWYGSSMPSEGEVEPVRAVLEERQVRDDEAVAGAPEEDPDEGDHQAQRAEQREQDDGGLPLGGARREDAAAIDVRDQPRADQHEARDEDAGHRGVEVGQQLLEAQEVPRRL